MNRLAKDLADILLLPPPLPTAPRRGALSRAVRRVGMGANMTGVLFSEQPLGAMTTQRNCGSPIEVHICVAVSALVKVFT